MSSLGSGGGASGGGKGGNMLGNMGSPSQAGAASGAGMTPSVEQFIKLLMSSSKPELGGGLGGLTSLLGGSSMMG